MSVIATHPQPGFACESRLPYLRAHSWNQKEGETRGPVERRHEPHESAEVSEFVGQESRGGRAEYVGEGDGGVDEGRVLDAEAQRSAKQRQDDMSISGRNLWRLTEAQHGTYSPTPKRKFPGEKRRTEVGEYAPKSTNSHLPCKQTISRNDDGSGRNFVPYTQYFL